MKTFQTECINELGQIKIYTIENKYSNLNHASYSIFADNGYEYKRNELEVEDLIRIEKLVKELFYEL